MHTAPNSSSYGKTGQKLDPDSWGITNKQFGQNLSDLEKKIFKIDLSGGSGVKYYKWPLHLS